MTPKIFKIGEVDFVVHFHTYEAHVYHHGITFVIEYGKWFLADGKFVTVNYDQTIAVTQHDGEKPEVMSGEKW